MLSFTLTLVITLLIILLLPRFASLPPSLSLSLSFTHSSFSLPIVIPLLHDTTEISAGSSCQTSAAVLTAY